MRGEDLQQHDLFSYGSLEERIPADHPLRPIRAMVDEALNGLDARFDEIYGEDGRRSIPPERLLRALLVQMLYSVRSERMLMEQLEYNLLFRWFVGLSANEPVWHPTVFTKNRDRLLNGAVSEEFFTLVVEQARSAKLLCDEHFTVDGTLIEAWAGHKSFQRKQKDNDALNPPPPDPGSNPTVNFRKEKRSNETHESLTDPEARLFKKSRGAEARLGYLGHVLTDNRHGLVLDVRVTQATGTAERDAAAEMLSHKPAWKTATVGADRGYDTRAFVEQMREIKVTPHVAQNTSNRRSAIDNRTTRHAGYAVSQRKRKRVEEVFGWVKTVALQRKTRFRGLERTGWMFTLAAAAYNLVRMRTIQVVTT
jgi:transposase